MDKLIVGNPGCQISEIIGALSESTVIGQLDDSLFNLAIHIGTKDPLKTKLRQNMLVLNWSSLECLDKLLHEWRQRCHSDAKLILFIQMLEKEDLNDFAQRLRERFSNDNQAQQLAAPAESGGGGVEIVRSSISQKDMIAKQQNHLLVKMPELIDTCQWNAALVARMQARGILSRPDVRSLDALPNPSDRAKLFFDFIYDRLLGKPEIYDWVIEAFEELNQSGMVYILKNVYD